MCLVACFADLPRRYLLKLLAADIAHEIAEKPLTYDENLLTTLSADDIKRLKSAHATFRYHVWLLLEFVVFWRYSVVFRNSVISWSLCLCVFCTLACVYMSISCHLLHNWWQFLCLCPFYWWCRRYSICACMHVCVHPCLGRGILRTTCHWFWFNFLDL